MSTRDEANARTKEVRRLIEQEHLSYTQAANRLGLSRSAVSGIVDRLRKRGASIVLAYTPGQPKAVKPKVVKEPQPKAVKKPPHQGLTAVQPISKPEPPKAPVDALWLPLPGHEPILVEHHHEGQCRWSVGHLLYCGAPVRADPKTDKLQNYCPTHYLIGNKPLPPKGPRP